MQTVQSMDFFTTLAADGTKFYLLKNILQMFFFAGKSRDITGSYTCVLLTVAGAQLLSAALYVVGYVYWRQEMAREAKERSRQTALLTHADFECEKLSQLEK